MAEKILIIDDDNDTIQFLSLILSQQGYQVITARDGYSGLDLAKREQPDLIVLDVMMPEVDGFQVTRAIRHQTDTANIPILMYTAKSQIEDKVTGYEAGVDFYLTKPIHPIELHANIKALIKRRQNKPPATPPVEKGYMVGVIAAKGGIGVSTLALNLGISYQQRTRAKVVAAELRPGQGTWGQELNLMDHDGLVPLLCMNPGEITQQVVEKQLMNTSYGVRLLLASNWTPDIEALTASAQLEAVIERLSQLANFVVLDIGTNYLPNFYHIVDMCNELVVIIEPQPITVKRTRLLFDDLKQASVLSTKKLTLVMNSKARTDSSFSVSQVEDILGQSVVLGIPPVPELSYQAAIRSIPLFSVQPGSLISQQYMALADRIIKYMSS
jgi:DNA-binding response OmpR family regulator